MLKNKIIFSEHSTIQKPLRDIYLLFYDCFNSNNTFCLVCKIIFCLFSKQKLYHVKTENRLIFNNSSECFINGWFTILLTGDKDNKRLPLRISLHALIINITNCKCLKLKVCVYSV